MDKKLLTTLKTSKDLKEVGFEVESEFSWYVFKKTKKAEIYHGTGGETAMSVMCNAYLTDELLGALPAKVDDYWLSVGKTGNEERFVINYFDSDKCDHLPGVVRGNKAEASFFGRTLPDTVAELVLWCIKEGHIKV